MNLESPNAAVAKKTNDKPDGAAKAGARKGADKTDQTQKLEEPRKSSAKSRQQAQPASKSTAKPPRS